MRLLTTYLQAIGALAPLFAWTPALAGFPGANGLIAFQTDRDGNDEIYVMYADGTGLRNLTKHPADDREPQWSPDGKRIVFRRGDDGEEREIWVMNADGSGQARLTENDVEDEKPSWAPDRTHVVFETDRDGEKQVYVMRRDGLFPMNLSNDLSSAHKEPVWAPDGSRIAYQRNFDDDDTREIWVMNPDGSGKTQLTDNDDEDEDPAWSPDGTRIVFESDRPGPKQLYVMNADGSGQTRLTTGGDDDVDPEWSPDGTRIVFVAGRHDNPELYVMNADGSGQTRLTNWPGDDENPSWQPIPTTTTTTPPTTTTTLPGGGVPLPGRKLLLKDDPAKSSKRAMKLVVKDAAIGTGSANGSSGDPFIHGGFLKLVSEAGAGFAASYDLPAASWRYQGKEGRNKGYKLRNVGPIRTAVVKLKKGAVTIVAKGEALGHALGADPKPVHVALGLGASRYCFTFGGTTKFTPGKKFTATAAPAGDSCVALEPVCGDQLLEEGESCPTLEGPPDGLAIDAVSDFEDLTPVDESMIGPDAAGDRIVRTQYLLVFPEDATVAAVHAVIAGVGGRIASMLASVPSVLIEVPDPESPAAVESLIAALESEPAVTWVLESHVAQPGVLPANYNLDAANPNLSRIDHQLAVRAHAAWNARGALQGSFLGVVVEDWFGDGVPDGDVDVHVLTPEEFTSGTTDPDGEHGYHVLGIIAGKFGGDENGRGMVTGMVTDTIPLRVIDHLDRRYMGAAAASKKAVRALAGGSGPRIFSTSLGYWQSCGLHPASLNRGAAWWIDAVRRRNLENKVLHVTAAGNINAADCPTLTDATVESEYAAASLAPIVDASGTPVLGLSNTLVIENAVNTAAQPFAPACLSTGSKFPGHLAGIGTAVWSFRSSDVTGIGAAPNVGDKDGTSMATPQVAGLAAYLWRLAPGMTVDELRRVLLVTSTENAGGPGVGPCAGPSAPVIDAYGAVLSLDEGTTPTPGSAPIRLAVLDVDDDGDFDELDLFEWTVILLDEVAGGVQEPPAPEYQRYDLNGDGWTGGAGRRAGFDLDRVGSTQYGASQLGQVTQVVEGVSVPFEEAVASDLDILCYYAYSPLYTGDAAQRTKLLGLENCARIDMAVSFPSVITPGVPETLAVFAGREGETGSEPVEGLHIQLSPAGGSAAPPSGTTNASGEFQSQVSLDQGSTLVEVVVQALTAPGGQVLAEEVVTAAAPCLDQPTMLQLDYDTGEADPTYPGPVLQNGADYRITASGTFSIWTGEWENGVCKGAPDAGPGGPTGIDVEYWFAIPVGSALCGDFECCPHQHDNFRVSTNGGGSFEDMEPLSPGYNPSHVYAYRVRGRGQPVHFQFEVPQPRGDDYGLVDVQIACDSDTTTTTTTTTTSTSTSSISSTTSTVTTSTSSSTTSSSVSTTSSTSTTLLGFPVVPYARYEATGPDGPAVMLVDEFASESIDLGSVALDLSPVSIDGVPALDPNTHQACYAHPGGILDDCIDVQNAFGLAPLRIGNPVGVCVPELFAAVAVDAFKCYAATGSALDRSVALEDEFQTQAVTVGKPELLCAPVAIDGAPLTNPARYLVCYATEPPGASGGQISVENALHGAPIQIDVGAATGLCVPAVRQIVPTCQDCGDSVTEGDEECDDGNVMGGDGCSEVCRFEP